MALNIKLTELTASVVIKMAEMLTELKVLTWRGTRG